MIETTPYGPEHVPDHVLEELIRAGLKWRASSG